MASIEWIASTTAEGFRKVVEEVVEALNPKSAGKNLATAIESFGHLLIYNESEHAAVAKQYAEKTVEDVAFIYKGEKHAGKQYHHQY